MLACRLEFLHFVEGAGVRRWWGRRVPLARQHSTSPTAPLMPPIQPTPEIVLNVVDNPIALLAAANPVIKRLILPEGLPGRPNNW
jgi:hypothetical protein